MHTNFSLTGTPQDSWEIHLSEMHNTWSIKIASWPGELPRGTCSASAQGGTAFQDVCTYNDDSTCNGNYSRRVCSLQLIALQEKNISDRFSSFGPNPNATKPISILLLQLHLFKENKNKNFWSGSTFLAHTALDNTGWEPYQILQLQ